MKRLPTGATRAARQRGVSLTATLLFTVAALLLGVSVMGINVMQERMVGNTRDRDLAFQAAEAALREAEDDILRNITPDAGFSDDCAQGLCTVPSQRIASTALRALPVEQQPGFSWTSDARTRQYGEFSTAGNFPNVAAQPRYVIENLGLMPRPPGTSVLPTEPVTERYAYRVTARATGARAETVVILQSIFYRI